MDEYPVRNMAGLQEHFSIEDILKYYSLKIQVSVFGNNAKG